MSLCVIVRDCSVPSQCGGFAHTVTEFSQTGSGNSSSVNNGIHSVYGGKSGKGRGDSARNKVEQSAEVLVQAHRHEDGCFGVVEGYETYLHVQTDDQKQHTNVHPTG